jgi:soluble lytic murein transglycosylase-like protein
MAPYTFDHHIRRAARAHRVDPLLIKAIIKTESNFDPYAVSSQGAKGLMQLMPGTARDLHVTDPFDAGQNIYGGTEYIRRLLDSYQGNLRLSLAAYNAGPGRVKRTVPRIPETVAYVSKVMRLYRQYRGGAGSAGSSINVRKLVTVN